MKKFKKLIPALAMLLVSAVLMSTASYAWFSMNNKVNVTGMEVTTRVSNNLLIAPVDKTDATKEGNTDSAYVTGLHGQVSGRLQPISTVDGLNYWYTASSNVTANGDAKTDVYVQYSEETTLANATANKTAYDANFNLNEGLTAPTADTVYYGFIEQSFYLKATNADSVARTVYMMTCNITYEGGALPSSQRSWRVALFVQDAVAETKQDAALTSSNLKSILGPASAAYFTDGKAISANAAPTVNVSNLSAAATIDSAIPAGTTKYYKVTVRLWLEGEDNTCNNDTFANLTGAYRLNMDFAIGDGTGVTVIGTVANAVATASGSLATLTLTDGKLANGETPLTINWKNASDDSAAAGTPGGTPSGATFTATATGKVYCEITTTKGNIYYSNIVDVIVS